MRTTIIIVLMLLFNFKSHSQVFHTKTINGTRQYSGIANKALLEIKLSVNNSSGRIYNPLIIVEGYDPGLAVSFRSGFLFWAAVTVSRSLLPFHSTHHKKK